ncbi:hypothetical protein X953_11815 [Virgibacillus sp. SK37]|nr:hypothetical protein X953_11815 [Virgibacillus sp. SK37]
MLEEQHISYGILEEALHLFDTSISTCKLPITLAEGTRPQNGEDGELVYYHNRSREINRTDNWNFRDVMQIPSVEVGEKLATISPPRAGMDGMDVYGNSIPAEPGKAPICKAGKNVVFKSLEQTYYAATFGQLCVIDKEKQVQPIFEVHETLSLKEGNLDFTGSIHIHGDVPSGYRVKAKGDITIFGMVEAATIIADGSITISEGLAGIEKGLLKAGENIYIGYI